MAKTAEVIDNPETGADETIERQEPTQETIHAFAQLDAWHLHFLKDFAEHLAETGVVQHAAHIAATHKPVADQDERIAKIQEALGVDAAKAKTILEAIS